jgi:Porin PorA
MRRDIGYILAGLGTFLIVIAVVLPTYIAPSVIKWPLNKYLATTLRASNASYFSTTSLSVVSGVTIEADYTFQGNSAKGTSSTAVWNEFNYIHDVTNHVQIQLGTRTFAFDRKSAGLVNCCGANVNGNTNVQQTGIAGYAFPIGTQKQTYMVYDVTAGKAEPFVYAGTATVDGIATYMFGENVAPTPATGEPVPANYENHVVYYVDPETGIPVDITEHEILTQQSSTGTLFDANLVMTQASINSLVSDDKSSRNTISLLRTIVPLGSGILGALLLVAGALLSRRRPGEGVEPVSAHVPATPDPATRVTVAPEAMPAAARDGLAAAGDAAHSPAHAAGGEVQGVNGQANHDGAAPDAPTAQAPATEREANSGPE